MTLDPDTLAALADAVAERLRPTLPPPGWPEGRRMMTEPELAQYLAVSQQFVRETRMGGQLRCTHLGRAVRYSMEDVSVYLERCRANGNGEH